MHTYKKLSSFVKKVINHALKENIEFDIFYYSPRNKYFIKINESELGWFSTQNKYILTFNKSSFKKLESILKKYNPTLKEGVDSLQKHNIYGYDIFQSVEAFTVSCYTAKSSKKYNLEEFEKQQEKWIKAQNKFNERDSKKLEETLDRAKKYLKKHGSELSVSRISGISHKIKVIPNTLKKQFNFIEESPRISPKIINTIQTKSVFDHISYRSVVFLFSNSENFPKNYIKNIDKRIFEESYPAENYKQNKTRVWKNSISGEYQKNPEQFNFYEKIGIFEIYNKK